MELYTVDPETYLVEDIVEGYSSLIWTDRYSTSPELQLKTNKIAYTKNLLSPGTLVAEKGSPEIMQIQTHSEGFDDNGASELTIKGKSLSTILMGRILFGDYKTPWEMQKEYTAQDALMVLLYNSLVNNTNVDLTQGPMLGSDTIPFHDPGDALANVMITDSTIREKNANSFSIGGSDLVTAKTWYLEAGPVYQRVIDFLALSKLGLRLIRPVTYVDAAVFVDSAGNVTKIPSVTGGTDPIYYDWGDNLRFDVYNGRNRTDSPSPYNPLSPVIFRYDAGHIQTPTYLKSNENYKNWAVVDSSEGRVVVWVDGTPIGVGTNTDVWPPPVGELAPPEGLNRFATYIDLGDLSAENISDVTSYLTQKGLAELKKQKKTYLMDGAISPNAPYQYGKDYFLGDTVTMVGQDGLAQDMQVIEYIRTEDADGDRGYPTLVSNE